MVGRGGWLPTSLQDGMSAEENFAKLDDEEFLEQARDLKDFNKSLLYPEGGWQDEPDMHKDRGMQSNKKWNHT